MEDGESTERRWEDMEIDIMVKIFKSFNIIELTSGISRVCSSWRLACCDPQLWRTLDLGLLKSNFIKIPSSPYVWVSDSSDKKLMQILKVALGLSGGIVTCLIFHFNLYLKDDHLIYTAERCPRLKRLVLPAWNRVTKIGICKAVRMWKELESLTMPSIGYPPYIMKEISESCKNFTELKIMALILILDCLEHLEVLNISHCLLIEVPPPPSPKVVLGELDETIKEKASRLREFITCQEDSCIMCQRTINDEGLMRWYKYEEGLWRMDEVRSLAHGREQHHSEIVLGGSLWNS
ncbi:PREDICTED: F-box/LRR-repeat protein At3g48880 isoform X2 [Nelumbo nucifera]|uniref:F-box/LRR-repeat protein At3g48880 isoform X2 n=2 Tax=Nelumbo nucifera TaxID=4432 RepID=A0A1U7ZPZ4_NELNU|nr:PREDICTED: F-box/LRR-repeat protein At3g48880 isoform X2 [Nelumbo nucifera]DAD18843.1 TPA_asm: hypothetical protein HUJ06_020306 [Nelumbo nucifera]